MRFNEITYNKDMGITKDEWKVILSNESITNNENKDLIFRIYNKENYMMTGKELSSEMSISGGSKNSKTSAWANRIIRFIDSEILRKNFNNLSTESNYWHVIFLGTKEIGTNHFLWILRAELKIAIDELIEENIWVNNIGISYEAGYSEELEINDIIFEGAKKVIMVNSYERNRRGVNICLEYYKELNNKIVCEVCGFDFEKVYGALGKDKIHVHHKKPISEIGNEYILNPKEDLVPVCPNCHMMIHSRKPAYSVEEIKELLKIN